MSKPTDEEMEAECDKTYDADENGSAWPGMSYEQGVRAALDWVLGNSDDPPIGDETGF